MPNVIVSGRVSIGPRAAGFGEFRGSEGKAQVLANDGGEYSSEEVLIPPDTEEETPPEAAPTTADLLWERHVERTKSGLLLLIVGYFLSWLPMLSFIGALMLLVGAIKVILGRKPFGEAHARNTLIAAALIVFGVVATVVTYALFQAAMAQATTEAEFMSTLSSFLVAFFAVLAVSGISSILLDYELQKPMGKALLAGAYGSSLVVFVVFYLTIHNTFQLALESGSFDSLGFTVQMLTLSLLMAAPAVLFAVAHFLAWNRVKEGEIPGRPSQVPAAEPAP